MQGMSDCVLSGERDGSSGISSSRSSRSSSSSSSNGSHGILLQTMQCMWREFDMAVSPRSLTTCYSARTTGCIINEFMVVMVMRMRMMMMIAGRYRSSPALSSEILGKASEPTAPAIL
eukprot:1798748-Amphidinium_carterae.2